jgi:hypothetical protein
MQFTNNNNLKREASIVLASLFLASTLFLFLNSTKMTRQSQVFEMKTQIQPQTEIPPEFKSWRPTDPSNRAPCPFLNTLSNHGLVPRTDATSDQLKSALAAFGVSPAGQDLFSGDAVMKYGHTLPDGTQAISLFETDVHG